MDTRPPAPDPAARCRTFGEFYRFYEGEHANATCRRLHVVGTSLALILLVAAAAARNGWLVLAALLCGYGFAWVGHYVFEKNRPATFTYPLWSLFGDFRLLFETLTGKRRW